MQSFFVEVQSLSIYLKHKLLFPCGRITVLVEIGVLKQFPFRRRSAIIPFLCGNVMSFPCRNGGFSFALRSVVGMHCFCAFWHCFCARFSALFLCVLALFLCVSALFLCVVFGTVFDSVFDSVFVYCFSTLYQSESMYIIPFSFFLYVLFCIYYHSNM